MEIWAEAFSFVQQKNTHSLENLNDFNNFFIWNFFLFNWPFDQDLLSFSIFLIIWLLLSVNTACSSYLTDLSNFHLLVFIPITKIGLAQGWGLVEKVSRAIICMAFWVSRGFRALKTKGCEGEKSIIAIMGVGLGFMLHGLGYHGNDCDGLTLVSLDVII